MTTTPKVLIAQQNIPAASTQVYVSPATGKGTWVDQFDVCNYAAGAITISVWVAPAGQANLDANKRIFDKSVASKATVSLDEVIGSFMNPGDSIYWTASGAASINGGASGREIT